MNTNPPPAESEADFYPTAEWFELSLKRTSQHTAQEVLSQEDINKQGGECGKE